MSLKVSRKAGDITMIQITLYNSGGYIKRSKFFRASFYCIPDIIKVSARHVFGRKNTSASMLRIYKNKNPLRALELNKHIISEACPLRCVRFPNRVSTLYLEQCIMALPCIFCIQKIKYMCFKKNIYIMYIYINSTLVSTIHITYKNIY